uniref:UHRF1 binding protein 1 n=1 Tax=Cyprinus carpio TaxID=7962 RepID=A0A8C2H666_CYPCA
FFFLVKKLNLSPDKINLSTLKGEGQLSNLELDEEVLQNMLDLPTWLAVTRVYCNKAAIRIQWTKLKTSPICLFLDKVEVEMRTCEEPRPPNGPSPIAITAGQSEYGFAEKVVEGMSVIINSITIKVQARAFHASFELWQLQGCSLNPKWQKSDLRYTRITHPKRGEVLTFKEINWQSLRIEADAIESDEQDLGSTPLRLITNQGRIRIALKRRVKDCNVLASKLLFILDDLLWVLTDSQLKAIIHYAKSLSEAMEKSGQQRKSMAAETLQTAPPSPGNHSLWTEPPPPETGGTPGTLAQYFDLHDVKESSYHTFISRLDLHICNDSSSESGRHSKRTQSLLSCNRKSLHLPDNTPAIHLQFTEYYFPDNPGLPVPCSNLYAQLNGLQLCLDAPSVLWMTLFSRGLHRTLDQVKAFYHLQDSSKTDEHIDIRLDAKQLKLIIPLESSILDHPDRPRSLSISLPQIVLSNTRHAPHGSHSDLNSTYSSFSARPFFHPTASQPFPRDQSILHPLPSAFLQHCLESNALSLTHKHPSRSQDIWSVSLSRVTLGFEGARRGLRGKALPFVEPFAISLWMCCPSAFKKDSHCSNIVADSKSPTGSSKQPLLDSIQGANDITSSKVDQTEGLVNSPMASIHILAQSITPVKMWLNHYQFVALLRMKDYLARLAGDLTKDVQGLGQPEHKPSDPPSVCVSILMEVIELALLLPPATSEPVEEAHSPEETDSPSLTDSDLSPSHHAGEPGLLEDSGTLGNEDQEDDAGQEGLVEEACEAIEEGMDRPTGQDDEAQATGTLLISEGMFSNQSVLSTAFTLIIVGCVIFNDHFFFSFFQVSVLVLCLSRMGCLTEMRGEDIVVALEAQELVPKQLGNHKVTDLLGGLALTQAGSSSPSAPLSPGPCSLSCPPAAALRMEMGPCAGRHSPLSESVGFMEMCLTGCKAELLASTLNTLAPFLEDELSTDPQPMRLWLRDTAITLKDDGPRVYPTAPQPVPVLFSLDGIVLERLDDGILSLRRESFGFGFQQLLRLQDICAVTC